MRSIKKLGLVGVAVLALAAFVGVSSASAAQWLDNGGAIGAAENTTATPNASGISLHHTVFGATVVITCTGGSGSGTVGPGAADKVNTINVGTCTTTSGTCTSPVVTPQNLPWTTSLVSTTEDDITAGTGGNPGWKIQCTSPNVTITCLKATTATTVANVTGGVNDTFTQTGSSTTCSDFSPGFVTGTSLTSLNSGHTLSIG